MPRIPPKMSNHFLTERELSEFLNVHVGTIRRWRLAGKGPRFRKFGGAVRYGREDIEDWIRSCPAGGQPVKTDSGEPESIDQAISDARNAASRSLD